MELKLLHSDFHFMQNLNHTTTDQYNSSVDMPVARLDDNLAHIRDYWALILVLFPFLTVFGNVLVILSVCRERSLQTVTNYFIVSLAVADLLVAALVMPFAVYVLVNVEWGLPSIICDFYIAMDVTCSTSSIFNLVAISIDRYMAVTQPIKYARHKNGRRVWLTIALVWLISAAIGSPIVLGLNHTPERDPTLCVFYNADFVIYSSLSSFYIPCLIMVFLYYSIFKVIRQRALRAESSRKYSGSARHKHFAETELMSPLATIARNSVVAASSVAVMQHNLRKLRSQHESRVADPPSASQADEELEDPDLWEECSPVPREDSTDLFLMEQCTSSRNSPRLVKGDSDNNRNEMTDCPEGSKEPVTPVTTQVQEEQLKTKTDQNCCGGGNPRQTAGTGFGLRHGNLRDKKFTSRFTIYRLNKASRKNREKSTAKKERKATKTLAIVLGVFLVCWVPFFTCNIMDAICSKLDVNCQPGVTAFILTTWLGYINSFINPVIYTIFNLEFRKAFKQLLNCS